MMDILISVQPKYVKKILSGEKTVEIRKTAPKFALEYTDYAIEQKGIDVYIYCTKGKRKFIEAVRKGEQNYYGDIACNTEIISAPEIVFVHKPYKFPQIANGKVFAKFKLNKIYEIGHIVEGVSWNDNYEYSLNEDSSLSIVDYLKQAGLTVYESLKYKGYSKNLYGWHIDNLVVFDKPKELSEFYYYCTESAKLSSCQNMKCENYISRYDCATDGIKTCSRPPQSWQYIEV